jgi:4-amino-4-deoxy-L-arabinose transferase-like glycosyltransferase
MKFKSTTALLLIVILATYLRFWNLGGHLSLYWEEVAIGYDAYSVLKTGKDYHGNPYPIVAFPSFGDYKPPLYFYTAIPSIWAFGLNEFGVRLPSALSGVAAVFLIYLIVKELKLGDKTALIAALLLAISPWHIQFSRAAFEVNLGTTLFLFGSLSLFKADKRNKWLLSGALAMVLSMYSYHGFRLLSPLMAAAVALVRRKELSISKLVVAGLMSLVIAGPLIINFNSPVVNQRFKETSFLTESKAVEVTNRLREASGNSLISRVVFHRYWWWLGEFLGNYVDQFDMNFIFLSGDENIRHGTKEFGLLYHWELISLAVGIGYLFTEKRRVFWIVMAWLLLSPIPAALTKTTPHALRFLPAIGAFIIISSTGLKKILDSKSSYIKTLAGLIVLVEFLVFSHFYVIHYPKLSSQGWQYGYKQAVLYVESVKGDYDVIEFTRAYGRPSIYTLFYSQFDPKKIQELGTELPMDQLEILAYDKYRFDDLTTGGKTLVVAAGESGHENIKTIDFLSGEKAFEIYEE